MRLACILVALVARVAAQADVTLMVVSTQETTSMPSIMSAGVSGGLAALQIVATGLVVRSTDPGYVIEIPTPDGKTADDIVAAVATCQFRGVLETSWSGDPVGLSDVEVSAVCKGAPGTNTCAENAATACGAGESGGSGDSGGSSGSGGSSEGLSTGAVIGIVLAAVSVLGILALIGIGIFNGMAMGTAATGINLATVPLTAATAA